MIRPFLFLALTALSWALGPCACASDIADPATLVVASVDGHPITLRQIEDALLKKEGADLLQDWVSSTFTKIDWAHINDDTVLIEVNGKQLHRRDLAVQLLKRSADAAREDLINLAVVEDAIAKQSITIDAEAADAAWASMKKEFEDTHHDGQRYIDFASFLQSTQHLSEEEFRHQAGFTMFAALRVLALSQARQHEPDATIQAWFENHRAKWDQPEAALLSEIYVTCRKHDENDQSQVLLEMAGFYNSIRHGEETFEHVWQVMGNSYDPDAAKGGVIGWIPRSGVRAKSTSPALPKELMDEVMAVPAAKLPMLLQPFPVPGGVFLLRVDAHRAGIAATLAGVRDQVIVDLVENQLKERMKQVLDQLRTDAKVDYQSLPEAVSQRGP